MGGANHTRYPFLEGFVSCPYLPILLFPRVSDDVAKVPTEKKISRLCSILYREVQRSAILSVSSGTLLPVKIVETILETQN